MAQILRIAGRQVHFPEPIKDHADKSIHRPKAYASIHRTRNTSLGRRPSRNCDTISPIPSREIQSPVATTTRELFRSGDASVVDRSQRDELLQLPYPYDSDNRRNVVLHSNESRHAISQPPPARLRFGTTPSACPSPMQTSASPPSLRRR